MSVWIKNMSFIHTVEYHATIEKKEILAHAITCMKFENLIVSEISQSQKNKYRMIPLT